MLRHRSRIFTFPLCEHLVVQADGEAFLDRVGSARFVRLVLLAAFCVNVFYAFYSFWCRLSDDLHSVAGRWCIGKVFGRLGLRPKPRFFHQWYFPFFQSAERLSVRAHDCELAGFRNWYFVSLKLSFHLRRSYDLNCRLRVVR